MILDARARRSGTPCRRGRRSVAVALFVAFALSAPASAARRPAPTACQPSAMIATRVATIEHPVLTVEQNQLFMISVGTNPSTGYHWVITPAKPVAFGFIGTTYRDGTPLRQAQQYDQYGQPIGQGQPQQYDAYGRPIQQPNPYGQQQTYNPYGQAQANPYSRPQSQVVAVGGEQLLVFKATVPAGLETMVLQYAPPSQPGQPPSPATSTRAQTFTIEVIPGYGC